MFLQQLRSSGIRLRPCLLFFQLLLALSVCVLLWSGGAPKGLVVGEALERLDVGEAPQRQDVTEGRERLEVGEARERSLVGEAAVEGVNGGEVRDNGGEVRDKRVVERNKGGGGGGGVPDKGGVVAPDGGVVAPDKGGVVVRDGGEAGNQGVADEGVIVGGGDEGGGGVRIGNRVENSGVDVLVGELGEAAAESIIRAEDLYLTLLASVNDNAAILPHHFEHYRGAGILPANMIVGLDSAGGNETSLAEWERYYGERGVRTERFAGNWTSCQGFRWMVEALARRRVTSSRQWVVVTDADELVRFPAVGGGGSILSRVASGVASEGASEGASGVASASGSTLVSGSPGVSSGSALALVQRLQREGATHAYGIMVDRVAEDGSLSGPQPPRVSPIAQQYPLSCSVTGPLAGGRTLKIPIHRGDLRTSSGHHYLWAAYRLLRYLPFAATPCTSLPDEGRLIPPLRSLPWSSAAPPIPIDHYKWDSGALAKLRHRINSSAETAGYRRQLSNTLLAIQQNGGCLPVQRPDLACFVAPP
eukprot:CAMPEP_0174230666 /NCGR_PEP_ID=MMETSP0417-20130205/1380_1 /TAXON_ID=242541 /ORGANISM="Mayorella sp, Strain BSH-02190019" /LENGTH=532 /DNA_ID=CAMNT_0015308399 /DNA_START=167 /DNA_END=1765 /DNA_ORIENTATION=+